MTESLLEILPDDSGEKLLMDLIDSLDWRKVYEKELSYSSIYDCILALSKPNAIRFLSEDGGRAASSWCFHPTGGR